MLRERTNEKTIEPQTSSSSAFYLRQTLKTQHLYSQSVCDGIAASGQLATALQWVRTYVRTYVNSSTLPMLWLLHHRSSAVVVKFTLPPILFAHKATGFFLRLMRRYSLQLEIVTPCTCKHSLLLEKKILKQSLLTNL